MAAQQASRRALLSALAVVPFAVGGAAVAVASGTDARQWRNAVALEQSTRDAFEVYHAAHVVPPSDKHDALRDSFGPWPFTPAQIAALDAIDYHGPQEQFNDMVGVHYDAFYALMLTPAPDVSAIAFKLDLFLKDESWDFVDVAELLAGIHADTVRLSRGGA